jgi:cytochrome c556
MRKWIVFAVVAISAVIISASASAEGEKYTAKQIMSKSNGGPKSLVKTIGAAVKDKKVDWPKVQAAADELAKLGEAFPTTEPKKGDKDSFVKLATKWAEGTAAVAKAAKAEDAKGVETAISALGKQCGTCHMAHR